MILSDKRILEEIEKGTIKIVPYDRSDLGSNSYDVHLGAHLARYTNKELDAKKISKLFKVGDWKDLRSNLLKSDEKWPEAFKVFEDRIYARFIDPIEIIISNGKNEGEGFTIALISVVLLEFLAAFELGKSYKTSKKGLSPNEYYSGINLLKSFLSRSSVFKFHFESKTKIQKL